MASVGHHDVARQRPQGRGHPLAMAWWRDGVQPTRDQPAGRRGGWQREERRADGATRPIGAGFAVKARQAVAGACAREGRGGDIRVSRRRDLGPVRCQVFSTYHRQMQACGDAPGLAPTGGTAQRGQGSPAPGEGLRQRGGQRCGQCRGVQRCAQPGHGRVRRQPQRLRLAADRVRHRHAGRQPIQRGLPLRAQLRVALLAGGLDRAGLKQGVQRGLVVERRRLVQAHVGRGHAVQHRAPHGGRKLPHQRQGGPGAI